MNERIFFISLIQQMKKAYTHNRNMYNCINKMWNVRIVGYYED